MMKDAVPNWSELINNQVDLITTDQVKSHLNFSGCWQCDACGAWNGLGTGHCQHKAANGDECWGLTPLSAIGALVVRLLEIYDAPRDDRVVPAIVVTGGVADRTPTEELPPTLADALLKLFWHELDIPVGVQWLGPDDAD